MIIRSLELADIPIVLKLREALPDRDMVTPQELVDSEKTVILERSTVFSNEPLHGFVAEDIGVVGYACLREHCKACTLSVFVVPEQRGKGVGRLLVERVLEVASSLGFLTVRVDVHEGNSRAVRFFLGFENSISLSLVSGKTTIILPVL